MNRLVKIQVFLDIIIIIIILWKESHFHIWNHFSSFICHFRSLYFTKLNKPSGNHFYWPCLKDLPKKRGFGPVLLSCPAPLKFQRWHWQWLRSNKGPSWERVHWLFVADLFVGEKVVGQVRYWFFCKEPKFGGKKSFSQSWTIWNRSRTCHKPCSFTISGVDFLTFQGAEWWRWGRWASDFLVHQGQMIKWETSLESLEKSEMPVGVPIVNSQPNSAWNYHLTNFRIFLSKSQTMGGLHNFHGEDQVFSPRDLPTSRSKWEIFRPWGFWKTSVHEASSRVTTKHHLLKGKRWWFGRTISCEMKVKKENRQRWYFKHNLDPTTGITRPSASCYSS